MCWWIKVSVPLLHNLGSRVAEDAVDIFYRLFHCLTDVVAGETLLKSVKGDL